MRWQARFQSPSFSIVNPNLSIGVLLTKSAATPACRRVCRQAGQTGRRHGFRENWKLERYFSGQQ